MSTKFVWTKAAGGFFAVPGEWDDNLVPSNGDDLVYLPTLSRAYQVTSTTNEVVGFLQVAHDATLAIADDSFTIGPTQFSASVANYGRISVGPGGAFVFGQNNSAELNGPGAVSLTGTEFKKADFTTVAVWTGLFGGGDIALHGNSYILGSTTSASTLENKSDTIIGWGEIGNDDNVAAGDGLWLINDTSGKIDANGAAGDALVIDTSSNLIANSGLIETTGAGGLAIYSPLLQDGRLIAAGSGALTIGALVDGTGAVRVLDGGTLALADGEISTEGALYVGTPGPRSGLLRTTTGDTTGIGTSGALAGDVIQTNVFNYGLMEIVNDSTLNLNATVTQAPLGRLYLMGSTGPSKLEVFGGGASIWGGAVMMSDSVENFIVSNGVAETLSNYADIEGAGTIGDTYLRLVNGTKGVIDANQSAGLTIVGDSAATLLAPNLNVGRMEATSAGSIGVGMLTIEGELVNSGTLLAASRGVVVLDGGAVDSGGGLVETTGNGEILLENDSTISGQSLLENSALGSIVVAGSGIETIESYVLNKGDIHVLAGAMLLASGQWNNSGVVNLGDATPLTGGANLEVAANARLDLIGAGIFRLANADDQITSAGVGAQLTNQSETIVGAGTIGDAALSIVNARGATIDATGVMILGSLSVGAPLIVNSGVMEASNGARLTIDGVLDNTGSLIALSGGTIIVAQSDQEAGVAIIEGTGVLDFSGLVNNEVEFAKHAHGELILGAPSNADGDIWGFATGDTIDLSNFKYVSGSTHVDDNLSAFGLLDGNLVLSNGSSNSQALYFEGDYQKGTFELASDHANGTLITWVAKA